MTFCDLKITEIGIVVFFQYIHSVETHLKRWYWFEANYHSYRAGFRGVCFQCAFSSSTQNARGDPLRDEISTFVHVRKMYLRFFLVNHLMFVSFIKCVHACKQCKHETTIESLRVACTLYFRYWLDSPNSLTSSLYQKVRFLQSSKSPSISILQLKNFKVFQAPPTQKKHIQHYFPWNIQSTKKTFIRRYT